MIGGMPHLTSSSFAEWHPATQESKFMVPFSCLELVLIKCFGGKPFNAKNSHHDQFCCWRNQVLGSKWLVAKNQPLYLANPRLIGTHTTRIALAQNIKRIWGCTITFWPCYRLFFLNHLNLTLFKFCFLL